MLPKRLIPLLLLLFCAPFHERRPLNTSTTPTSTSFFRLSASKSDFPLHRTSYFYIPIPKTNDFIAINPGEKIAFPHSGRAKSRYICATVQKHSRAYPLPLMLKSHLGARNKYPALITLIKIGLGWTVKIKSCSCSLRPATHSH